MHTYRYTHPAAHKHTNILFLNTCTLLPPIFVVFFFSNTHSRTHAHTSLSVLYHFHPFIPALSPRSLSLSLSVAPSPTHTHTHINKHTKQPLAASLTYLTLLDTVSVTMAFSIISIIRQSAPCCCAKRLITVERSADGQERSREDRSSKYFYVE